MLLAKLTRQTLNLAPRYSFASAASVDYYKLLGIGKESTRDQIHEAFAEITKKINPDNDPYTFNKLSEAFVILSDNKARDAYDSLLRSYKVSYINEETSVQPKTRSYLSERRQKKREETQKQFNIDAFGRYKGGLPNRRGEKRGKALGEIGQLVHPLDIQNQNNHPDHPEVDTATAESFKNFHQDERENRKMKRPWMTFQVDYNFFSLKYNFKGLAMFQFFIAFFFLIPVTFQYVMHLKKQSGTKALKAKREAKRAQEQKKLEEEQAKQAEQEKAQEQD